MRSPPRRSPESQNPITREDGSGTSAASSTRLIRKAPRSRETIELVAWVDGYGRRRMRDANVVVSHILASTVGTPLQIICGPVLITGGSPEGPLGLGSTQVVEAFERLGLEVGDEPSAG
ncbi:hypothetical protein KDK95_14795 [Actinospica sp. MGRD01-02]|uniref:Uncharacterized protein n=1 Tax=Actinospica acidithermotolerans TaxID=2828514 RepID=A0A941EH75_9ACTN|nr:hypothetical protein [Actinospica acidithermotolerans]MBR7827584.1 hypothetical protein [Actinospica acidithermotolerans]